MDLQEYRNRQSELVELLGDFITGNSELIRSVLDYRSSFPMASSLELTEAIGDGNIVYLLLTTDTKLLEGTQ